MRVKTTIKHVIVLAMVALSCASAGDQSGAQEPAAVANLTPEMARKSVMVRGEITNYRPPTGSTMPHSFQIRDASGSANAAVWDDVWLRIPVRSQLRTGQKVTARCEIAVHRGQVELQVKSPDDIALNDGPLPDPAPAATTTPAPLPDRPVARPQGNGASKHEAHAGSALTKGVQEVQWETDISTVLARAMQERKRVLAFFTKREAASAEFVETRILSDPGVRTVLAQSCLLFRVDLDKNPEMGQRLGVFRAGMIIIYGPDGTALQRLSSINEPGELLDALR